MTICEFCRECEANGKCRLGLNTPKTMSCHDFNPGIENFCSVPDDFVNAMQIVQMATYFGMKKAELKKVKNIALLEEKLRLLHLP